MSDAKVTVGVEGAEAVLKVFQDMISNAKKVGGAVEEASTKTEKLGGAAKEAGKFWQSFGKDIGSSLQTVATSAIATVTAVNTISFAQAIESAKALDNQMMRFATGSGRGIGNVREQVRGLSRDTNTQEKDVLAWSKSLGRVTYDSKSAMDAYKAFSDEALASNQEISEQGGLAATLSNTLGVKGDQTQGFLDSLRGMSEAAGNAGGFNAFKDQITALDGPMSQLSLQTDKAKTEFLALQASLAHGLTIQQGSRVQQTVTGFITSHAEGFARDFGRDNVFDEQGHVKITPDLLNKFRSRMTQRYGLKARQVLMQPQNLGPEAGAALFDADLYGGYDKIKGAGPSADPAVAAAKQSAEWQRQQNELKAQQVAQDTVREANPIRDWIGAQAADHPFLTQAITGAGLLAGKGLASAGWSALTGSGGAAAGSLSAGGGLLSAAAVPAAALFLNGEQQGQDQDALNESMVKSGQRREIRHLGGLFRTYEDIPGGSGAVAASGGSASQSAAEVLAQGQKDNTQALTDLPDQVAKALAETLKGSPLNVVVLNQTGGPIKGVAEVQKKTSPQ